MVLFPEIAGQNWQPVSRFHLLSASSMIAFFKSADIIAYSWFNWESTRVNSSAISFTTILICAGTQFTYFKRGILAVKNGSRFDETWSDSFEGRLNIDMNSHWSCFAMFSYYFDFLLNCESLRLKNAAVVIKLKLIWAFNDWTEPVCIWQIVQRRISNCLSAYLSDMVTSMKLKLGRLHKWSLIVTFP